MMNCRNCMTGLEEKTSKKKCTKFLDTKCNYSEFSIEKNCTDSNKGESL